MKDEILDDFSFIDEDFSLYEISNNQRTLIFISVFIIFLNTCKYIFDVFFPHAYSGFTDEQVQLYTIIGFSADCYWYYFMFNYLKFYKLKSILNYFWIMLIGGLGGTIIYLLDTVYLFLPESFNVATILLNSIGLLIFSIKLLNLNSDYTGIGDLKTISILNVFIAVVQVLMLFGIIWFFIEPKYDKYVSLLYVTALISDYFFIKFVLTMKINKK